MTRPVLHWRVRFVVTTRATPDQVRDALTDFSSRRLLIWKRTLDPRTYEVRAVGETWAVARESSPGSPFWVVCRYDWSDPDVVRWTVDESSWGGGGTGSVRTGPAGDGCRLEAEWGYTGLRRVRDRLIIPMLGRPPARLIIARMWRQALDAHADRQAN